MPPFTHNRFQRLQRVVFLLAVIVVMLDVLIWRP
jgi:hypothetical protein